MTRPWHIAVAFGLCLAVVLAAMGWVSLQVVRLDRAQAEAQREAQRQENVRLALWRMESALAPLVAQEASRPYFVYSAVYPAERAYANMFNRSGTGRVETLLPSPLLTQDVPYVLLHFQIGPDGTVTSPKVQTIGPRPDPEDNIAGSEDIAAAATRLARLSPLLRPEALRASLPPPGEALLVPPAAPIEIASAGPQTPQEDVPQQGQQAMTQQQAAVQRLRNETEFQARSQQMQIANTNVLGQNKANPIYVPGAAGVSEGVMRAAWLGDALVLARRVRVNGREYVQGAWLDWPALRQWLLTSVKDLVPEADLVPVRETPDAPPPARPSGRSLADLSRLSSSADAAAVPTNRLAALPIRLTPGQVPTQKYDVSAGVTYLFSPLILTLAAAWVGAILAVTAVGALLLGTVRLSERRADFVSSVTHELRTPLTTFRMYSEMLAGGMVPDEAKRHRYLVTLRVEAERLSHLVENVLAYARLERGRARGRVEDVTLAEILDRTRGRLADRAGQAGMELVVDSLEGQGGAAVRADTSAVEQILFNLVDNACKYAVRAEDKRIHLAVGEAGGRPCLRVCDHGPGITAAEARRLFRPFSKSARDAANSAPGVGLGLALSRRLAREMGGDLTLEHPPEGGACFVLRLPCLS